MQKAPIFKRVKSLNPGRTILVVCVGVTAALHPCFSQTSSPKVPKVQQLDSWSMASACRYTDPGELISAAGYRTIGWTHVTVPSTVLAGQLVAGEFNKLETAHGGRSFDPYFGMNLRSVPGTSYPVGTFFSNQEIPTDSPYACGWWYRSQFTVQAIHGRRDHKRQWLRFAGINYAAEIWINGHRIADRSQVAGAYRRYEFDVTEFVHEGAGNTVAVETFAPGAKDLGINWVDWNPCPADKDMGLWGSVTEVASGDVTVRSPMVETHFVDDSLGIADLTVRAVIANASDKPINGTLHGSISGLPEPVDFRLPVQLSAHESRDIEISPTEVGALHVNRPEIWWPYGLGSQHLNEISLDFVTDGVSDAVSVRFGVREMSSELDVEGHRLFKINRHPILIRGGGWSPDMLLRESSERLHQQFKMVRDLHLNTLRLEGKLETEEFFNLADQQGVLVMAGWCCCDHWEHWKDWTDHDLIVATESLRSQLLRLRSHASLMVWLNGSDGPPTDQVENAYLTVEAETHWPNAILSSASAAPTVRTGKSGVKMLGPYDYVVPSYWLRDTEKAGGAFGFNTETSPGPAVPNISELRRFLPEEKLWPINTVWDYHTGGGKYKSLAVLNSAMDNIYGQPRDLPTYIRSAESMEYDAERAMFEAYGRNKYHSTGVVQWMLNNAWPSLIWHLYDFFLQPGAGYYGVKKANEPVHVQYSYDDGGVVVVNSTFAPVGPLTMEATVIDMAGQTTFHEQRTVEVAADSAARISSIPTEARGVPLSFVRLTLTNPERDLVSTNTYWIPKQETQFEWSKTDYTHTPPSSYEDLTALKDLQAADIAVRMLPAKADDEVRVELRNRSSRVAFQVSLTGFRQHGLPYDSLLWSDNYVEVLPGETRVLSALALRSGTLHRLDHISISGWNIKPVSLEVARSTPHR